MPGHAIPHVRKPSILPQFKLSWPLRPGCGHLPYPPPPARPFCTPPTIKHTQRHGRQGARATHAHTHKHNHPPPPPPRIFNVTPTKATPPANQPDGNWTLSDWHQSSPELATACISKVLPMEAAAGEEARANDLSARTSNAHHSTAPHSAARNEHSPQSQPSIHLCTVIRASCLILRKRQGSRL